MASITNEAAIRAIVRGTICIYAETYALKRMSSCHSKSNRNLFIETLNTEQYDTALLAMIANVLQNMAVHIAKLHGIKVAKVELHSKEWWDEICRIKDGYEVVLEELSSPMAQQASRLVLRTWNKITRKQIA